MDVLKFEGEEYHRFAELAMLYMQAKSLILYAEEADPDSRSNIQIIKELRDAFDHLMRVVLAHVDEKSSHAGDANYGQKNLHKAIGHVYRATFDALDGTVLSLRVKIVELLEPYSSKTISEVLPTYWDMRAKLEEVTARVAEHRSQKDVGADMGALLDAYTEDVEKLKDFHTEILSRIPALNEHHKKQCREKREEWAVRLFFLVCGVMLTFLLRLFLA